MWKRGFKGKLRRSGFVFLFGTLFAFCWRSTFLRQTSSPMPWTKGLPLKMMPWRITDWMAQINLLSSWTPVCRITTETWFHWPNCPYRHVISYNTGSELGKQYNHGCCTSYLKPPQGSWRPAHDRTYLVLPHDRRCGDQHNSVCEGMSWENDFLISISRHY